MTNDLPLNYLEGDIFEAKTQVIINTVNCEGVMGKGLALQFKKKYPEMFKEYQQECKEGRLTIGKLHLYKQTPNYWILNFPTKNHWRNKSKLDYIEKGLAEFKNKYQEWGITSIAFPRLGCQQGGLDWADVKTLMEKFLGDLPGLRVEIFSYRPIVKKSVKQRSQRKRLPLTKQSNRNQSTLY